LLPAVQKVREAAARARCQNNLKQLALACRAYHDAYNGLPRLYSTSSQLGWVTQILPHIEQANLAGIYNFNQPWFDASNAQPIPPTTSRSTSGPGRGRTTTTSRSAPGARTAGCRAGPPPSTAATTGASTASTPPGRWPPSPTAPSTGSAGRSRRSCSSPSSPP